MSLSQWFRACLTNGADELIWALGEVPEDRRRIVPPSLSDWPAHRHLYHLWLYERYGPLLAMPRWLPDSTAETEAVRQEAYQMWESQDSQWQTVDWDELIVRFQENRAAQIALLDRYNEADWSRVMPTLLWGDQSLKWVVTKTFQHAMEHTNTVMQIVLFWEWAMQKANQS